MLGGTFSVAFGLRSYSPELGRWINRDPIGGLGYFAMGLNWFSKRQLSTYLKRSPEARHLLLENSFYRERYSGLANLKAQYPLELLPYWSFSNSPLNEIDIYGEISVSSIFSILKGGTTPLLACTIAWCIWRDFDDSTQYLNGTAERSWWVHCFFACRMSRKCLGVFAGPLAAFYGGHIIEMLTDGEDDEEDIEAYAYGAWTAALDGARDCGRACAVSYSNAPNPLPRGDDF